MEILNFSFDQIQVFILILVRVSVVLFLFPILGSEMFPTLAKAGLAIILTLVLYPLVKSYVRFSPDNSIEVLILIVSELMIGLILGLIVRMFLAAVQLSGNLISFQMGFTIASVVDPMSGESVSITEQIGYWVALLIFIILNGHHAMILALVDSFKVIDIGSISLNGNLFTKIIGLSSDIFTLAIKIGSPAIAALVFTSFAFGLCAKFMPQMNIMVVGFPVQISVGLIFFGISLHISSIFVHSYVARLPYLLTLLLRWMGGG